MIIENESIAEIGLIPEILPRYRSTYFNHIFSGGYSSDYNCLFLPDGTRPDPSGLVSSLIFLYELCLSLFRWNKIGPITYCFSISNNSTT